jgi:hypothetical protein
VTSDEPETNSSAVRKLNVSSLRLCVSYFLSQIQISRKGAKTQREARSTGFEASFELNEVCIDVYQASEF